MSQTLQATTSPGTRALAGRRSPRTSPRRLGDSFASTAFLLPIMAVFVVLFAVPLGQTVFYSFTDFDGFSPDVSLVGLENYQAVFTDPTLLVGLSFTLLFATATTVGITVLAIPLSVVLNAKFFGRNFARSLLFFIGVPSLAILGLVWQYIFSPLDSGALNSILGSMGLDSVPWLADSTIARWCVIFVAIWAGIGWHATLYLAYLQAIPADLYEQAQIDGATGRQQFTHITLPQLVPAIVVSTFLLVTAGLKVYDLVFAMTRGGPGYSTNTITQAIITQGLSQSNYGVGSALAVLFTIASIVIILAQLGAANAISRRFS